MSESEGRPAPGALAEDLRLAVGAFVRATRARADTLQRTHADALGTLDRDGPRSIAQLAEEHRIRHQGMSRTVAELDRLGFITRSRNPDDARGWLIEINDAGERALGADRTARRALLEARIRDQLTDDERRALAQVPGLLRKLAPPSEQRA